MKHKGLICSILPSPPREIGANLIGVVCFNENGATGDSIGNSNSCKARNGSEEFAHRAFVGKGCFLY